MKCPTCGERTKDDWKTFVAEEKQLDGLTRSTSLEGGKWPGGRHVTLDWMRCANEECAELVIRIHEQFMAFDEQGHNIGTQTSWSLARPRVRRGEALSPNVDPDLRRDYEEAFAVMEASPRMSAVLSRRILAELLERHAGLSQRLLVERIDTFIADRAHPRRLRENLHYLRQIGNFAAHTQRDYLDRIVDVDSDEAAWTLTVIRRLFDYFVDEPETDRTMRESLNEKFEAAGKKKIPPLPDDEED